ncbi:MAG: hypothetical protein WDA60_09480 [Acidimicrobiia bacterium]|jgi:hypothetical protein
MTSAETTKVSRADIEAKLRQIQGDVETGVETGREFGKVAAIAGVVVALGVIYLMGRRHGRKKRTIVEIKRV